MHERGEFLGVEARRGHTGVGQPLGGLGHLGEQKVHGAFLLVRCVFMVRVRRRPAGACRVVRVYWAAASFAAESASTHAWMTGSSSPSSTWSKLYALKPTRWSEMRFSGKLYVRMRSERSTVRT